jgi:hypothetical protein
MPDSVPLLPMGDFRCEENQRERRMVNRTEPDSAQILVHTLLTLGSVGFVVQRFGLRTRCGDYRGCNLNRKSYPPFDKFCHHRLRSVIRTSRFHSTGRRTKAKEIRIAKSNANGAS